MKHVDLYYQAIILWDMDGGYCCRHDELGIVRPSSGFPRVELAYPIVDPAQRPTFTRGEKRKGDVAKSVEFRKSDSDWQQAELKFDHR